jgi:hypothetical protein
MASLPGLMLSIHLAFVIIALFDARVYAAQASSIIASPAGPRG